MTVPVFNPDPANFTTKIDNPFFSLRPGSTFFYDNQSGGEEVRFETLRETAVINGVTCVVVHDTASVNGIIVEDTFDWFAQDLAGNVWYFGEATQTFEPGNPIPISTAGSWKAGVDGASPGIVMLADPAVGDAYAQEFAPGIAEDRAKVLSLSETVHVSYGTFDDGLKTRDINPLGASVENKFYVAGVGNVLTTNADGEYEQLVRIEVEGTDDDDVLRGYAGGDQIFGRDGNDILIGGTGNDNLSGGADADILRGGHGYDRLKGGGGDDVLTGGKGGDRFVFVNLEDGRADTDTITDYRRSQIDVIEISGGTDSIISDAMVGGVWQLTLAGDGDVIRLLGVVDTNNDGHIIDNLLIA